MYADTDMRDVNVTRQIRKILKEKQGVTPRFMLTHKCFPKPPNKDKRDSGSAKQFLQKLVDMGLGHIEKDGRTSFVFKPWHPQDIPSAWKCCYTD